MTLIHPIRQNVGLPVNTILFEAGAHGRIPRALALTPMQARSRARSKKFGLNLAGARVCCFGPEGRDAPPH